MGVFGSKPKPEPGPKVPVLSDADKARLDIKRQRDRFSKAEGRMKFEADALEQHAKAACFKGDKEAAMRFLKLSKLKVKRREQLFGMIANLQTLLDKLDEAQDMAAVAKSIELGTAQLRAIEAEIPVERAERIMEDAEDALAAANEIDEVFSRELLPPGADAAAVGASLGQELDRYMAAAGVVAPGAAGAGVGAGAAEAAPVIPAMPAVPVGAPIRVRAGSEPRPVAEARVAVAGS